MAGEWVVRHRKGLVWAITLLLGVFLPIPGFIVALMFFPAGVHDLDTTRKGVEFLCLLFGVSAVVWGSIASSLLPRSRS